MDQWREKFRRFMIGRYGADQLGRFLAAAVIVMIISQYVLRFFWHGRLLYRILNALELVGIIWLYFRIFSKNIQKRWQENQIYLRYEFYVTEYIKKLRFRFSESRKYRIFKCPGCGQKVRVPRGHGKIRIHCPKCGTDFIRKS